MQRLHTATTRLPIKLARLMSTLPKHHPIIDKLQAADGSKTAVAHVPSGNLYSYSELVSAIAVYRKLIDGAAPPGSRIAIMGENSFQFVAPFYACMTLANTVALPICTNHTRPEIEYQLNDAQAAIIITPRRFQKLIEPFADKIKVYYTDDVVLDHAQPTLEDVSFENSGYILYTSGTSGRPKGVLTPLKTFLEQAKGLTAAWNINQDTNFLHTLPLHHIHGILIAMSLPLLAGGTTNFLFPFSAEAFFKRLSDPSLPAINTYTAVPTIYTRLTSYDAVSDSDRAAIKKLKLAMCGSAALPTPLRQAWEKLSGGQVPLLERYGMSETGITLSQPLEPALRKAGSVGHPVPGVVARVVDSDSKETLYQSDTTPGKEVASGNLLIGGPFLFEKYWNKPEATKAAFSYDADGFRWFDTGDVVSVDSQGNISILGRASMDIIKSGGEKISALEIEREILSLDGIAECAVVGMPSEAWGEQVTAIVVFKKGKSKTYAELKSELKQSLAGWKIPKEMIVVHAIPRNQMGKVNKKDLVRRLQAGELN